MRVYEKCKRGDVFYLYPASKNSPPSSPVLTVGMMYRALDLLGSTLVEGQYYEYLGFQNNYHYFVIDSDPDKQVSANQSISRDFSLPDGRPFDGFNPDYVRVGFDLDNPIESPAFDKKKFVLSAFGLTEEELNVLVSG